MTRYPAALETDATRHEPSRDEQIVRSALNALDESPSVPSGCVRVLSRCGTVTLSGEVDWAYQRDAAVGAIRTLPGVREVICTIRLTPHEHPVRLKARVEWALRRSPRVDPRTLAVDYVGGRIVLRGWTRTWSESDEAERLVWSTPGVALVDNQLTVGVGRRYNPETIRATPLS
jgi:osmotically-inducible protein OsmY